MDKKSLRMQARLDGVRSIAERHGKKVKVSEMELMALCSMAQIGLYEIFAEMDGKEGEDAQRVLEEIVRSVREVFGQGGQLDGLTRLCETVSAILDGEKLKKYIIG